MAPARVSRAERVRGTRCVRKVGGGFQVAVARQVERGKNLAMLGIGALADDFLHLIDLEVDRPGAIGHGVKLREAVEQRDGVEPLRKEIDGGRAKERERSGLDAIFQARLGLAHDEDEFDLLALRSPAGSPAGP